MDLTTKLTNAFLKNIFFKNKGILLKVGQILNFTDKLDSLDINEEITQIPPEYALKKDIIKNIFEENFHQKYLDIFKEISSPPQLASLAQVHQVQLRDSNENYCLKVQYPNIEKSVFSQLKLMNLIPENKNPNASKSFPIQDYQNMLESMFKEEISYTNEIQNLNRFTLLNRHEQRIVIPRYLENLCSDKILTLEWIEGKTLKEVKTEDPSTRRFYAETLLQIFLKNFFIDGFIQADANPGNFLFQKGPQMKIAFLDFGNFLSVPKEVRLALARSILGVINGEEIDYLPLLHTVGLNKEKIKHFQQKIPLLLKVLFAPFLSESVYNIRNWKLKEKVTLILGEDKWFFRSAGTPLFFQIIRSFLGLKFILKELDTPVFWKKAFFETLIPLTSELAAIKVNILSLDKEKEYTWHAQNLQILIIENGNEKVRLSLPVTILFELENNLDTEILSKLSARKIDVKAIAAKALSEGALPGLLFQLEDGKKTYQVSLV